VRFVSVLFVIVYCEEKSAVAAVRVTFTVPLPVSVPPPLRMTNAAGVSVAPAPIVRLPEELKFRLALKPLVLLTLTLLKAIVAVVVPPNAVAAGVPGVLKFTVLDVVNVNGVTAVVLTVQLPRNVCVSEVPPLKVAVPPMVRLPLSVNAPPAVLAPEVESVR